MIGEPGNRNTSRICSHFVDDLEQYQEIHKVLKDTNEIIVQASNDTRTATECRNVPK